MLPGVRMLQGVLVCRCRCTGVQVYLCRCSGLKVSRSSKNLQIRIWLKKSLNRLLCVIKAGFRTCHILSCESWSFRYGSTWKCIKIKIVEAIGLSITLPIICYSSYTMNYIKTRQKNRGANFHNLTDPKAWVKGSGPLIKNLFQHQHDVDIGLNSPKKKFRG